MKVLALAICVFMLATTAVAQTMISYTGVKKPGEENLEQNRRGMRSLTYTTSRKSASGPSASTKVGIAGRFAHARRPMNGLTGVVKWFNPAKGFGFITPDDGSEDLFAHFSAVTMSGYSKVKEGARVSFDVLQGPKGKQASNIQLL